MDMQINQKMEIWLNGKYLFTADAMSMTLLKEFRGPTKNGDSTNKGVVLDITKNDKYDKEEKSKAEEENNQTDYDVFFKKMVSRVGDKEFHQPLR